MEEKTLFKLIYTETVSVSSKGGTVTYRIKSLRRKLVNGKVVSTITPSCSLSSASVSWAIWGGVTVGDGYLDVKINYSENTGSSRSTTLIFDQDGSDNKINLIVTQESGITYTAYLKLDPDSVPTVLGGNKGDTLDLFVAAYLKGSDGSETTETPNVDSFPDWGSVSIYSIDPVFKNHHVLTMTALSSNQTGAYRSGYIVLTCWDASLSIPVRQRTAQTTVNITISVSKSPTSTTSGICNIRSDQPVADSIEFRLQIQYGVSSGDVKKYIYTLVKGSEISKNTFPIQNGANPQIVSYDYAPQETDEYIYSVSVR